MNTGELPLQVCAIEERRAPEAGGFLSLAGPPLPAFVPGGAEIVFKVRAPTHGDPSYDGGAPLVVRVVTSGGIADRDLQIDDDGVRRPAPALGDQELLHWAVWAGLLCDLKKAETAAGLGKLHEPGPASRPLRPDLDVARAPALGGRALLLGALAEGLATSRSAGAPAPVERVQAPSRGVPPALGNAHGFDLPTRRRAARGPSARASSGAIAGAACASCAGGAAVALAPAETAPGSAARPRAFDLPTRTGRSG